MRVRRREDQSQVLERLLHQLNVGSLIFFTFFMISDPKTTPDRRFARILFTAAVAGLAFVLQQSFWWYNALIWALLLPVDRYQWLVERTPYVPPEAAGIQ